MEYFAVLDTETNWYDEVMSIGVVIAEDNAYEIIDSRYYVFDPEYLVGGMYSLELEIGSWPSNIVKSRKNCMEEIDAWLKNHSVKSLFAYNATFDKRHLPELNLYDWFDIMRVAAYRQRNKKIPRDAECCKTGRLKRGFGVEPIMRLLSENQKYYERHNALQDAIDELEIMKLLGKTVGGYYCASL